MATEVNGVKLSDRTVHYLNTILWAERVLLPVSEDELVDGCMDVDEDHPLHGIWDTDALDEHFGISDFTAESLRRAEKECADFFDRIKASGAYRRARRFADDGQIAHDFWLTRNGHGAGFWDGDYADHVDQVGDELSDACEDFEWGCTVFVSEDGCVHLED